MANYGLYANINEGSLQSSASSLKAKAASCKGELESFKGTLTDDMWKATAKQTLLTGYDKLSSEVYSEIESKLDTIVSVCNLITQYKEAETYAKIYQEQLSSGPDLLGTNQRNLQNSEQKMNECEAQISSLCGG